MTYYTITTNDGAEYFGLLVRAPNDILELFQIDLENPPPGIIGVEVEGVEHERDIQTVYIRHLDIRSVTTWGRARASDASTDAPEAEDSASSDDAPP